LTNCVRKPTKRCLV